MERKTKIVCTLGPATQSPHVIKGLIRSGMDIVRLNFSHGSYAEHSQRFSCVRTLSRKLCRPVGIMQDLEGYKIRLGRLRQGPLSLKSGQMLKIDPSLKLGDSAGVGINYPSLGRYLKPGDLGFVDDGRIRVRVRKIRQGCIFVEVINEGVLSDKKGIQFPRLNLPLPSLTKKDQKDIAFGLAMGVDYIALSFVRSPQDVQFVRHILKREGASRVAIVAKIENRMALDNIKGIVKEADAIMVARGDLGVSVERAEVPLIQKEIIRLCNSQGVPVITATHMLESMVESIQPTRAEVNDIANTLLDGTDGVLLSAETAVGHWPREAVQELVRIINATEVSKQYRNPCHFLEAPLSPRKADEAGALGMSIRDLATLINARFIIAFTRTGQTAREIWKFRPRSPILAATPSDEVFSKLILLSGVIPLQVPVYKSWEGFVPSFLQRIKREFSLRQGEILVLTAGLQTGPKIAGSIKVVSI